MKKNPRELRAQRAELINNAMVMVEAAEAENRDFTEQEQSDYDEMISQAGELETRAARLESMTGLQGTLENRRAPNHNRGPLGDSEVRALAAYFREGAVTDLADFRQVDKEGDGLLITLPGARELRAIDSTMNITTAADGGAAVPTGFAGEIARRRNEIRLTERLGVRRVPGSGTTVNYPYEDGDPSVFATTSEQNDAHENNYERDAAKLATKAFTLVKKTKKIELTEELLDDEDADLNDFVADMIGRGLGMTHNSALLTEVAANGSALTTFASATALAAGEPEDVVFSDTLGYYLDDGGSIAWVLRPTSFGAIASITGNARLYAETPAGSFGRQLLGYPAYYSNYATAIAASAKSVYFGNWFYVGFREDPALRIIRDPYTVDGLVILKYSHRIVYGVLIAGAVGYGAHPTG